jgi:hypothetical protein
MIRAAVLLGLLALTACADIHNAIDYGVCSFEHQNCGN